jgi:hypothetical protein
LAISSQSPFSVVGQNFAIPIPLLDNNTPCAAIIAPRGRGASRQSIPARLSLLRLASSPEYRLCGRSLRTPMPNAFFCPTSTSSRLLPVIPVKIRMCAPDEPYQGWLSRERVAVASRLGRAAAQTPEALAKQADSQRRHSRARSSWDKSSLPAWLTPELFSLKIQPLLSTVATSVIRSSIGVSRWYASQIQQGYRPHPRHWEALAELVGIAANEIQIGESENTKLSLAVP